MKFAWVVAAAAILIATATQASAAVIYTYAGTLGSDLPFPPYLFGRYSVSYASNNALVLDVDFGLPRTLTQTALGPDFSAAGQGLPPPDLALPAPVLYTIDIFTPSAPLTAGQGRTNDFWYDEYLPLGNGKWENLSGADDLGADNACCFSGDPIDVFGNVTTTSVLEKVTYKQDPRGYVEFDWPGDIWIEETLDPADVGKPYFLEIFASVVPEPSTWAMYILGLGTVGIMLRRRRRNVPVS